MFRRIAFFVVLFVAVTSACAPRNQLPPGTKAVLEAAESFELLSLDPIPIADQEPAADVNAPAPPDFHGFKILGQATIEEPKQREALRYAFEQGVVEHDGSVAACFNPRHGLRATVNEKIHDFVICFECRQVEHYVDGAVTEQFLISNSPSPVFDQALRQAGVQEPDGE